MVQNCFGRHPKMICGANMVDQNEKDLVFDVHICVVSKLFCVYVGQPGQVTNVVHC